MIGVGPIPNEEELLRQGILPPPEIGQPAPGDSFIDAVNAQPLPPGASTGQMPAEWPPPVPAEAPGMVPQPAPLPGAAPTSPAVPQATGPRPAPGTIEDLAQAQEASDKAQVAEMEQGQGLAHEQAELASQRRDNAIDNLADQQAAADKYDAAESEAQKHIDQADAALKKFKFKQLYDDAPAAYRIGSALAVAIGTYGAGLSRTPSYALQVLDKQMDDYHRQQVDELNQLRDEDVMARTGLHDVRQARTAAFAALQVKDAARDRLIATKLDEAVARNKDNTYGATLASFSAKLKEEAAEKQLKARALLATEALKAEHMEAENKYLAARTAAADKKAHGGGAGGGGGSGAAAGTKLGAMIEAGKDGKPLTETEIYQAADQLHIPHVAKAGHESVKTIMEAYKFRRKELGDASKAGGADITGIDKRAKDVLDKQLVGTQKSPGPKVLLDRMSGMTHALGHAIEIGDKNAAILALDEGSRLISGSAPTKTSTHLLQEMKSASDEMSEKWGHFAGNPGATKQFTARIKNLLETAAEEKRGQIDQIRQDYLAGELGEHGFSRATPEAKERVMGHAARMFGSVRNAGGTARYDEGRGAGGGHGGERMVKVMNQKTGESKMVTESEARQMGAIK